MKHIKKRLSSSVRKRGSSFNAKLGGAGHFAKLGAGQKAGVIIKMDNTTSVKGQLVATEDEMFPEIQIEVIRITFVEEGLFIKKRIPYAHVKARYTNNSNVMTSIMKKQSEFSSLNKSLEKLNHREKACGGTVVLLPDLDTLPRSADATRYEMEGYLEDVAKLKSLLHRALLIKWLNLPVLQENAADASTSAPAPSPHICAAEGTTSILRKPSKDADDSARSLHTADAIRIPSTDDFFDDAPTPAPNTNDLSDPFTQLILDDISPSC